MYHNIQVCKVFLLNLQIAYRDIWRMTYLPKQVKLWRYHGPSWIYCHSSLGSHPMIEMKFNVWDANLYGKFQRMENNKMTIWKLLPPKTPQHAKPCTNLTKPQACTPGTMDEEAWWTCPIGGGHGICSDQCWMDLPPEKNIIIDDELFTLLVSLAIFYPEFKFDGQIVLL